MKDHSFGIIPAKKNRAGKWEFLVIQHHAGHWGFPKGHAEVGEKPLEAASRELFEETGLSIVELLASAPLSESYVFTERGKIIFKTVDYFLAQVQGRVVLQAAELSAYKWVLADEAAALSTFPAAKKLSQEAYLLLP